MDAKTKMPDIAEQDLYWMKQALDLGEQGRLTAPPNPWVGCVLVKEGRSIGKGFHSEAGTAHAEIKALEDARKKGLDPKGASCYVTLEPCCHHGRTPPCTLALIKAQVKRVVIALKDPDIRVSGLGAQSLQAAGIEVSTSVLSEEAQKSLTPYLIHRQLHRPFCIAKAAISVDGRLAAPDFSSKWISEEAARSNAHLLRAQSQAILVGSQTALLDQPALTVRHPEISLKKGPLRVVIDRQGKVPPIGPLFDTKLAPTLIVTSHAPLKVQQQWRETGAEVAVIADNANFLLAILQLLAKRGVLQLLVEGGGATLGHFLQENFIDQLTLYMGPRVIGKSGIPLFGFIDYPTLAQGNTLKLLQVETFANTVRLDYELQKTNTAKNRPEIGRTA